MPSTTCWSAVGDPEALGLGLTDGDGEVVGDGETVGVGVGEGLAGNRTSTRTNVTGAPCTSPDENVSRSSSAASLWDRVPCTVPVTPVRLNAIVSGEENPPPPGIEPLAAPAAAGDGPALRGKGAVDVPAPPEKVWQALLDPESLKKVIPGCHSVSLVGPNHYKAEVSLGVGPIKGRFTAHVKLSDLVEPKSAVLSGALSGPLGNAEGSGNVTLSPKGEGTHIEYTYAVAVAGKVAAVGGRMLERASGIVIGQFFSRLPRRSMKRAVAMVKASSID